MGSKVIAFRAPEDLANEVEKVCTEKGMTTNEFLKKVVDEALYPSKDGAKVERPWKAEDPGIDSEQLLTMLEDGDDLNHSEIEQLKNELGSLKSHLSRME